jgi:hypothetical protein
MQHARSKYGGNLRIANQQRLLLDDSVTDNATAGFKQLILVAAADTGSCYTVNQGVCKLHDCVQLKSKI